MEGCSSDTVEQPECEVLITESQEEGDTRGATVLRHFIETYETLAELWDPSHPSYKDKSKRNVALDTLAGIYGRIKPGADRDEVRRKINTLRSNYRKELNKIVASMRLGNGVSEVYRPTSWVFHALSFLHKYDQPVTDLTLTETTLDDGSQSSASSQADQLPCEREPVEQSAPIPLPHRSKKQCLMNVPLKQNELLSLPRKYLDKYKETQEGPTIAKVWGEKLKTLEPQQRLFAEKAVNDVLFEASLGNLHRHSVKINEESYH